MQKHSNNNNNMEYQEGAQYKTPKERKPFSHEEDDRLRKLVEQYGDSDWIMIASGMKSRSVRQCRERWKNSLSSEVVKTKWTKEEDELLTEKFAELGPRWKTMEESFPGRTSYNIRNRYHSLSRKIKKNSSKRHSKVNQSSSNIIDKTKQQELIKEKEPIILENKMDNQISNKNDTGKNNLISERNTSDMISIFNENELEIFSCWADGDYLMDFGFFC